LPHSRALRVYIINWDNNVFVPQKIDHHQIDNIIIPTMNIYALAHLAEYISPLYLAEIQFNHKARSRLNFDKSRCHLHSQRDKLIRKFKLKKALLKRAKYPHQKALRDLEIEYQRKCAPHLAQLEKINSHTPGILKLQNKATDINKDIKRVSHYMAQTLEILKDQKDDLKLLRLITAYQNNMSKPIQNLLRSFAQKSSKHAIDITIFEIDLPNIYKTIEHLRPTTNIKKAIKHIQRFSIQLGGTNLFNSFRYYYIGAFYGYIIPNGSESNLLKDYHLKMTYSSSLEVMLS